MDASFGFNNATVSSANNVQVCLRSLSFTTQDPGAINVFVMIYIP